MNILRYTILLLGVVILFGVGADFVWYELTKTSYATELNFGKILSKSTLLNRPVEKLVLVGDIMLARDVERKMNATNPEYPFLNTGDLLKEKIVVGNFEASVPKVHIPTEDFEMKFSVPAHNISGLGEVGITHLSLANNHSLDHGGDGYINTVEELEENKIAVFGHPTKLGTGSVEYVVIEDKIVAIIGINATYYYPNSTSWETLVIEASERSDFQLVYIHWGDEYESIHSQHQEKLAHELVDHGVDLIVGHHPHVVQDVERYKNGLIFYSLGNFIFDQYFNDQVQEGLVLKLLSIKDKWVIELYPVESKTTKAQPRKMNKEEKHRFLTDLSKRSQESLEKEILSSVITITR